jgi:hypothetical protein
MDDFTLSNLHESRNEWSARLITILTPLIVDGFNSIFKEAITLCLENDEDNKYLMTFQNFISRIPKWSEAIVENETQRIIDQSKCNYLGDLLSCVHIIQLKILTCVRTGKTQKNINIDIPSLNKFLHNIYINVARKLYTNIYLFEKDITPLQKQKYTREFEIIIQECILTTIRETMPIEQLLKAYLDESIEEDVIEEIIEKPYTVVDENINNDIPNTVEQPQQPPQNTISSNFELQDNNLNKNISSNNINLEITKQQKQQNSDFNNEIKKSRGISFNTDVVSNDNTYTPLNDEDNITIHNEEIKLDDFININTNDNEQPISLDFEELK